MRIGRIGCVLRATSDKERYVNALRAPTAGSSIEGRDLPARSFVDLRRSDPDQHTYFLGHDLEGIPFHDIRTGNKLPPLKKHVIATAAEGPPSETGDFVLNQSLARGGLAMSWGAGAMPLRESDFDAFP